MGNTSAAGFPEIVLKAAQNGRTPITATELANRKPGSGENQHAVQMVESTTIFPNSQNLLNADLIYRHFMYTKHEYNAGALS